jgi:hypothetical protein
MTNYQITFDPDGGDLGRAEFKWITPLEFQIILPHIAYILECLYLMGNSRLPFRYAFEFPPTVKDSIFLVMKAIKLPEHVKFYEVDRNQIFEMRGASGGVAGNMICYLVTKE